MPNFISEDQIEQELVRRLRQRHGFDVLNCDIGEADDQNDRSGRTSKRDVILVDRVREAAVRLNPRIPAAAIGDGFKPLSRSLAGNRDLVDILGTSDLIRVHCTVTQWGLIATTKHPPMRGRIDQVKATLENPDEIRRSVRDPDVLLFHRRADQRWDCAVARRTGSTGFLITAYPADKIKQGEVLWTR